MSRYLSLSEGDRNEIPLHTNDLSRGKTAWPRQEDAIDRILGVAPKAKSRQVKINNKHYLKIRQQGRTMDANFEQAVRIMTPPTQQDTFVNNKLGDTLRHIKSKLGNDPFVEAYKAALNTFKTPDKRWKDYIEEEIRKESIFVEG